MPWGKCVPVIDEKIIGLCGTPYHGHRHGCSNFCKRSSCPPTMQPLSICLDDFYLIYIKYALGRFVREKLRQHPDWSIYQARNVLYWQRGARRIVRLETEKFLRSHPNYRVLGPKEHLDSWGVDMTASMAKLGIRLRYGPDWGLHEWTYKLRYAGVPIEKASPARLKSLARKFPWIYEQRTGRCKHCHYRPCLKYMRNNPGLYVTKQIGPLKIQKLLVNNRWLIRCSCGNTKTVPINAPLCTAFDCVCQSG